ncbi:MAG TPA: selenoneine biosynthesis selenosugar synthase SenB [Thiobacillaceae bacterium]|nr:selenoneine biosynthesis selenosugar synthase SenB [Thiobacillaceae bacterium]HNU65341.1 selenoneine biosynthesis selenosugar synthase SenB [Thiobacillaceae bacterium]
MRIALITPYLPVGRNGNAHTAVRWRAFLRQAGHQVGMTLDWRSEPAQAMIALHARRSHAAIVGFARAHPERSLVVVLTGTDLYRDIRTDAQAQYSLQLAHVLVVLQEQGVAELPLPYHAKTRVIYQSAPALPPQPRPTRHFSVGMVAHLRHEKDPFRLVAALEHLPAASQIRAWHVGGEIQPGLAAQARVLAQRQPRWRWLNSRPHGEARRRIARSHLLVVPSRMEGGANVICEAVTAGTPVLASNVPGNVGMLGTDYAGYFPLEDDRALAALLFRAETDAGFYAHLVHQCALRAPLFDPHREAGAVQALLT